MRRKEKRGDEMKQDVCVSYLKTKCVVSVLVVLWWENKRRVETERNKKLKKREEMRK